MNKAATIINRICEHKTEKELKAWDSLFFNTLEYFSFLLNKEYLSDKKILNFFEDAIIAWYEKIFLIHSTPKEQKDNKVYPELKKLYQEISQSN